MLNKKNTKKITWVIMLLTASYVAQYFGIDLPVQNSADSAEITTVQQAFKQRQSDVQIEGEGRVLKVLADDNKGSRHQRFILKLSSGQTLLVAHNIDLAPKLMGLKAGDTVRFFGEYEWNEKGGILHWTHDDPKGHHVDGWLKFNGRIYQ
jgi:molybdopterin converting factor small subunit